MWKLRIWFVPVEELDDRHLLGEHMELHTMASVLIRGGGGWYNHPATQMFKGKLGALYRRHEEEVFEMRRRGWTGHRSPFPLQSAPPDQMDAEVEVSADMIEKDRLDLSERRRMTELANGGSWRKARDRT